MSFYPICKSCRSDLLCLKFTHLTSLDFKYQFLLTSILREAVQFKLNTNLFYNSLGLDLVS